MTVMQVYFKQNNIYPTVLQWVRSAYGEFGHNDRNVTRNIHVEPGFPLYLFTSCDWGPRVLFVIFFS